MPQNTRAHGATRNAKTLDVVTDKGEAIWLFYPSCVPE